MAHGSADEAGELMATKKNTPARAASERGHARRTPSTEERLNIDMRHAQKLQALGLLATGIAHEISTPVQFVGDSMTFLRGAFCDLERFAMAVQTLVDDENVQDVAAVKLRLRDMLAESDVDYVIARMPRAVDRVIDGLSRVSSIVRAMKDFSHLDQREKQPADLNDAIDKTLIITKGEYKHVADVIKELGVLPRVRCHVGDIQQVLVNLVINASHAIESKAAEEGKRGLIRVRSFVEEHSEKPYVVVAVQDNGGGIPTDVAARVFEPFFTTKEPGRGTGQGLPISREIVVDRHGGSLEFDSVPGVGTTFYVRLPVV